MLIPALLLSLLPVVFEPNQGQADARAHFVAHLRGRTALLDAQGAVDAPGMHLRLLGANPSPQAEAAGLLPGKSHYLGPRSWRTSVPTYQRVIYHEVYPGIDLVWSGPEGELKYEFLARPGADRSRIALEVNGAPATKPAVNAGPVVIYSTYLGGSGRDSAAAVAVDRWGNAYVAGMTQSSDFPTSGGSVQPRYGDGNCVYATPMGIGRPRPCSDAFVTKINTDGSAVVWSSYLGGSSDDSPTAVAVDQDGNVYMAGLTSSADFPLVNPLFKDGRAFVAKLSADGSALVYATRLGPGDATVSGIAVDPLGNLYLAGTAAGGFPTVNPAQLYHQGAALYKTSDRGGTWAAVHGVGHSVNTVLLDPRQPSTMYVSGSSHFKSIDGGATWQVLNAGVIALDPTNSSVLYGVAPSSPQKSEDGGRSWRAITAGLPVPPEVKTIAVDPNSPSTIYAATVGNGVYKSTDGGNSWFASGLQPASIQDQSGRVVSLAVDPKTPATVYAGAANGIYKTIDGGATWRAINNGLSGGGPWFVMLDPATPSNLYAALVFAPPPQVFKSKDGGNTWQPSATGLPMAEMFGLALNALQPLHLVLATSSGPFLSTDGAQTWNAIGQLPYGTSAVAIDPTTETIYTGLYGAGDQDAFVAKLNATGTALLYSTYLGGSATERAIGISADGAGRAYVTGATDSPDFPIVNAIQTRKAGTTDAFAAVLSPEGSRIMFSTYFRGQLTASTVDQAGNLYLAGATDLNAGFLAKLDPTASKLSYSYNFVNRSAAALGADPAGNVYAGGSATADACGVPGGFSGHAFKLGPDGSTLLWSTCLAGTDSVTGLAVDPNGGVIVTGSTESRPLPVVNPLQRDYHGNGDSFVIKLADTVPASQLRLDSVVNAASYQPEGVAPGGIVSLFGAGLATGNGTASTVPLPTALLTRVTFNGIPAPLYFVSPGQINAQVPWEIGAGPVTVEVTPASVATSRTINVVEAGAALFSANAQGSGPGAILHGTDFSLVTDANPAHPGEVVAIYATGLGRLTETVATGAKPPEPPPRTMLQPEVHIARRAAEVLWSGAAPGYVGLYQLNVRVPADTPAGVQPVQIGASNTVSIAVR